MKILKISTLLVTLGLLFPVSTSGVNRLKTYAVTDWQSGKIIARGVSSIRTTPGGHPWDNQLQQPVSMNEGRLLAAEHARDIAMEKLVKELKKVRLNHEETLETLLHQSDYTRKKISKLLHNYSRYRETPADYFHSACTIEISLRSIIASLPYRFPGEDFPARMDTPISTEYSSLIVDTRGLKVSPMLFPAVLNSRGREVYSRYHVNIRKAGSSGMVAYTYSEDIAMQHIRAGNRPYYAVALKKVRGCPVLSERDVRKIYSSSKTLQHLKNCRVIFIIDRK